MRGLWSLPRQRLPCVRGAVSRQADGGVDGKRADILSHGLSHNDTVPQKKAMQNQTGLHRLFLCVISAAQVSFLHRLVVEQLGAGTGGDDLAGLQHVAPVCHRQGHLGVLLHQQNGGARLM